MLCIIITYEHLVNIEVTTTHPMYYGHNKCFISLRRITCEQKSLHLQLKWKHFVCCFSGTILLVAPVCIPWCICIRLEMCGRSKYPCLNPRTGADRWAWWEMGCLSYIELCLHWNWPSFNKHDTQIVAHAYPTHNILVYPSILKRTSLIKTCLARLV